MEESPILGMTARQKRHLVVAAVAAVCFTGGILMTAFATHTFANPKDVEYVTPPLEVRLSVAAIVMKLLAGGFAGDGGRTVRVAGATFALLVAATAGWTVYLGPFLRRGQRAPASERWIGTLSVLLLGLPGLGLALVHLIFGGDATVESGFYVAFFALWIAVINDGLPDRMPRVELEPNLRANLEKAKPPSAKRHKDVAYYRAMFDTSNDQPARRAPAVPRPIGNAQDGANDDPTGPVVAEANARGDVPG